MKKLLLLVGIIFATYLGVYQGPVLVNREAPSSNVGGSVNTSLSEAFLNHASGTQVTGNGTVVSILRDDRDGSRHQRFIVRLDSGHTLLIAHNIDLAPRVVALDEGDKVSFKGEYEWNSKGGVIHWTHHDPDGSHVAGWLKHGGNIYQ